MNEFFNHPLVKPDFIQEREYQKTIAETCLNQNTLLVLATGLGKTPISLRVMVNRLQGGNKVIITSPTKPLNAQHFKYFYEALPYTSVKLLNGEVPAEERLACWKDAQLIISTPQTLLNDVTNGLYSLEDVSLLVIDECHRTIGNYAFTGIAKNYMETAKNPLILAMTASPGSSEEKVNQIKDILKIEEVIIKSEDDPDVAPYLHEKNITRVVLDLHHVLADISLILKRVMQSRIMMLRKMDEKISGSPSMAELNRLKAKSSKMISEHNGTGYQIASILGEIMKVKHAILITETQGILPLRKYFEKLEQEAQIGKPKSSRTLVRDELFSKAFTYVMKEADKEVHPKPIVLMGIVKKELAEHPDSRILIFANYRDMGSYIVGLLNDAGIRCAHFTGQAAKDGKKGLSQKKQTEMIQRFKSGEFQVLVSTSVGEEGLDIPSTDVVIFYEPVPSEVRSIQRRGRTGRFADGKVIILVTKGTDDEKNLYAAQRKEENMRTMDHTTRQVKIGVEG